MPEAAIQAATLFARSSRPRWWQARMSLGPAGLEGFRFSDRVLGLGFISIALIQAATSSALQQPRTCQACMSHGLTNKT